jgi:hypothetical protein
MSPSRQARTDDDTQAWPADLAVPDPEVAGWQTVTRHGTNDRKVFAAIGGILFSDLSVDPAPAATHLITQPRMPGPDVHGEQLDQGAQCVWFGLP